MHLFLALLLAAAAQDDDRSVGLTDGFQDIVGIDTTTTDTYRFAVTGCERIRAFYRDPRSGQRAHSDKLVITLLNRSNTTCLFRGVVLLGWLEGVYVTSQRTPQGGGFFLPPQGEVSIRIEPNAPELPRAAIELQLPPGRSLVVLRGLSAEEALALPVARAPLPEDVDADDPAPPAPAPPADDPPADDPPERPRATPDAPVDIVAPPMPD